MKRNPLYLIVLLSCLTIHAPAAEDQPKKTGIALELYDMAFWQQANPIQSNAQPVYSEVVDSAFFPDARDSFWGKAPIFEKWKKIFPKLTSSGDLNSGSNNQKVSFPNLATSALKGYFMPRVSGLYTFSLDASDYRGTLYLDTTCVSWKNAVEIVSLSGSKNIGKQITDRYYTSSPIYLEAGKGYPIFAVYWFVNHLSYGIRVQGPGLDNNPYLPSDLVVPLYDPILPNTPASLQAVAVMDQAVCLTWKEEKNKEKLAKIAGYSIYVNGEKNSKDLIERTSGMAGNLLPDKVYQIGVAAVDELGNESPLMPISVKTAAVSKRVPKAPASITRAAATGESLLLTWGREKEMNSSVIGYGLFLNDMLYTHDKLFSDSLLITGLTPKTEYKVNLVAVSSSLISSKKSKAFRFSTGSFDPLDCTGLTLGEHRLRLSIQKQTLTWSEGLGINVDMMSGKLFEDSALNRMVRALHPGVLRRGALDANPYAFEKASGPDAGKAPLSIGNLPDTHARNMAFCNEIGAYYALCIGTKEGPGGLGGGDRLDYSVDYRTDPNTFLHLIEYLAGPADSKYGAIRKQEGYEQPLLSRTTGQGLLLELGNEVWGGTAHNAPIGDDFKAYGEWCRSIATLIRTSPYWKEIEDKVYLVYSGRNPSNKDSYGLNETVLRGDHGELNTIGLSGYLGGNMDYNPEVEYGESVHQYFQLRQKQMASNLAAFKENLQTQMKLTGTRKYTYLYESQVSTPGYYGTLGQAIVLCDYLTSSLQYSSILPTIFNFGGGEWRITMNNGAPLAHYTITSLINKYCKGNLMETKVETNNKLSVLQKEKSSSTMITESVEGHSPVGICAYNNGANWSILLFSRDFEYDYSVQLVLPEGIKVQSTATCYIVNGATPSEKETFTTVKEEGIQMKDGMLLKVPKHSMVLYTFKATDPQLTKKKLGELTKE